MSSEGTEDKRSGTARFSLRVPALLFAEVLTEQSGTYDKGEGAVDMVRREKYFSRRDVFRKCWKFLQFPFVNLCTYRFEFDSFVKES